MLQSECGVRQKVILIVDDIAENLEVLARNIQRLGHKVLMATSGERAIELAIAKKPDLILLDLQMPVMNGFEVCRILKADSSTAEIPIIFLTARTERDSIIEAFELGAVDYVLKPFYNEELFARLQAHLGLRELTQVVQEKNETLEKYVSMIDDNIAISRTDKDGIVKYVSAALCEIVGYKKEELIGLKHNCFKSGNTPDEKYKELWETILSGKNYKTQLQDKKKSGELFWCEINIAPQLDKSGEIEGFMAIWHDISDKKRVEELVSIDPMTRLYNRRHLENEMTRVLQTHARSKESFAFLMIDIDYFKLFNDFYGHQRGDTALISVATKIKESLKRGGDTAYRFGGEEFCVILQQCTAEGALAVAQNVLEGVREIGLKHQKSPFGIVTVSIGVALLGADENRDFDAAVKAADSALYEAKRDGRNRVCIYK